MHIRDELIQLLEVIPVGIAIHQANGSISYLNPTGARLLGKEVEAGTTAEQLAANYQIYRAGTQQLYPTEEMPSWLALKGEIATADDIEMRYPEKTSFFEVYAAPIKDKQGNIIAAIATFIDITERKQAEKLLADYSRILEVEVAKRTAQLEREIAQRQQTEAKLHEVHRIAHIGNWEYDIATKTTTWSEELYRIHGLEPNKTILQPDESNKMVYPDDRDTYLKLIQEKVYSRQPFETDLRIIRPDGEIRYIEARGEPISNEQGEIVKYLGTVLDITERKLVEIELQKAKEAAEVANQAKSTFLANMSHELRTPLNAILGFSQLLHECNNLNPDERENLSIILRSGEHLLSLINQVLDLAKIDAGCITLSPTNFDLMRLLKDVENMFLFQVQAKGLQLIFEYDDIPQYVQSDEIKLRQVLINLLSNAIKFTQDGGVTLRVSNHPEALFEHTEVRTTSLDERTEVRTTSLDERTEVRTTSLEFEISDTGCGIAADELDNLFQAFVQTQSGEQTRQGTGLGLVISQKFIKLMGGDITVSSELGKGTTFKFNITVSLVDDSSLKTQQLPRRVIGLKPNQPRYRLLIVDDIWDNRQLLIKLLKPFGFELQEASNGVEALEIYSSWQPHLIFLDMRMPVMDGYETTRQIKIRESVRENFPSITPQLTTKIIAITASISEELETAIVSAGCDDFIRKPFTVADIFAALHNHLGVQFIYDKPANNEENIREIATLTPETLAALPADWVAAFKKAAIEGDIELMLTWIEEIRPRNQPIANTLGSLVHNFQFEEILNFIGY